MKTIKLLILSFCMLFSMMSFAQNEEAKRIQFQARAGLNSSSLSGEVNGTYGTEKSKVGFNVGGVADIVMGKNFYFQPGLSLTSKGSKLREMPVDNGGRVDLTMNALYLQIPVYFAYKIPVYHFKNSFNIAMGPYFAYGVGGKIKGPGVYDVDTFGDKGFAKRTDVGLGMEIHFEMPKVIFLFGFEGGFSRVLKREYFEPTFRNSSGYWGVGYKF